MSSTSHNTRAGGDNATLADMRGESASSAFKSKSEQRPKAKLNDAPGAGTYYPDRAAIEPQITGIYCRFGLNDRQIEILSRATPKRDYYCQSRRGNRLFELGLGAVTLALTAASSKTDQALIERVLGEHGRKAFLAGWLQARGVPWAADLIPDLSTGESS